MIIFYNTESFQKLSEILIVVFIAEMRKLKLREFLEPVQC